MVLAAPQPKFSAADYLRWEAKQAELLVSCSAIDAASSMVKSEPKLIIEVRSPSTAAYDRGLRFRNSLSRH
jgi:hypothetical protein